MVPYLDHVFPPFLLYIKKVNRKVKGLRKKLGTKGQEILCKDITTLMYVSLKRLVLKNSSSDEGLNNSGYICTL